MTSRTCMVVSFLKLSRFHRASHCYTRSLRLVTPACLAQCAQQYIAPRCSRPCPIILQPQWAQVGAKAWIAHSKESKVCVSPSRVTVNALSYSLPHRLHVAMTISPNCTRSLPLLRRGDGGRVLFL